MSLIIRRAPLRQMALRLRPAMVPMLRRLHTNTSIDVETEHIDPIELHKFLQARDRAASKEFLEDEKEMIASESFNVDAEVPTTGAHPGRSKAVNEEFAKQIQDLLHPDYGSEAK
ncbi:hypothetical protein IWW55_007161 [Coemansia sp. RSA 2706]|nr:hypothetical protein LPJ70_001395 [Coemansia sp. RSA 2708]KAJ2285776.1 hypothetical protein IWW55_007161 [Coemansia sp. RSA 2706]KAJ2316381.1 hypothetical protein IWW52_003675 [Coemansia sp. RSA 2704]KAJ2369959.1 hypothetical protein H4S01_000685 [Coemansia sp. RSA 2610]KAJ2388217.1 hypothetical protein H4S02_002983 [Coemansia sp. RSA 2611]